MFFSPFSLTSKLHVQLNDHQFDLGTHWQMHQKPHIDNCNHKFTQLKVVVVRSFKFLASELELLKIILQRATILEMVFLILPENGCCEFRTQDVPEYAKLINSWKVSTKAKVNVYESYHDECFGNPTHSKRWILDPF